MARVGFSRPVAPTRCFVQIKHRRQILSAEALAEQCNLGVPLRRQLRVCLALREPCALERLLGADVIGVENASEFGVGGLTMSNQHDLHQQQMCDGYVGVTPSVSRRTRSS